MSTQPHVSSDDNGTPGPDDLLAIGEVSERTGVAVSALHYWERLGLIASVRTEGNQRRYPRHMLRRISLLIVAKRIGIPLADVKDVFDTIPLDATPTHQAWQRTSRMWREQLRERRRTIDQLDAEITGCIGCGCLSMKACALLNPADELAQTGQGPRRL
ncbi:MAG: redox-sensitive transcriptional activator SoxR [Mycetocola sp.]